MCQSNVELLYDAKAFPIFQNRMYDSREEAMSCPLGDIRLVEDLETGLVYNEAFRPELMDYDCSYQNEQAVSAIFQQHLNEMTNVIERRLGKINLVEIGCGKGFFLELLLSRGFDVTGFDPSYEGNNPRIKNKYFDSGQGIKSKGIILRHVLEHVQNPVAFLMSLRDANDGAGMIYIEVPCFDWICQNRAWFDVFYEHVNYFRESDFYRTFENVIESGKGFGGQYLYVVADLASIRNPEIDHQDRIKFLNNFLDNLGGEEVSANTGLVIWGG